MRKIPAYRRKKVGKHCYAVVTIKGKDLYLGDYDTKESKTKYERLVGESMQGGSRQSDPAQITVTEVCIDYTREMKKRYQDESGKPTEEFKTVQRVMKRFREYYGNDPASSVKAIAFKFMRQSFIDDDISRKTINKYCTHFIRALKLAAENEKLPSDNYLSMQAVETLKKGRTEARETKPIPPVPEETIDATLPYLPPIVADMVRIQLLTGMRPNELCQVKPELINRDGDVWIFKPEHHKNSYRDQSRVIAIGPEAQEILTPYLLRQSSSYCFDPSETVEQVRRRRNLERKTPEGQGNCKGSTKPKSKPKRQAGDHYKTPSYRKAIHRACERASINRWSPNQIRKQTGVRVRKENGLEAAQAVLGHKHKSTTERYYAAMVPSVAEETMRNMG